MQSKNLLLQISLSQSTNTRQLVAPSILTLTALHFLTQAAFGVSQEKNNQLQENFIVRMGKGIGLLTGETTLAQLKLKKDIPLFYLAPSLGTDIVITLLEPDIAAPFLTCPHTSGIDIIDDEKELPEDIERILRGRKTARRAALVTRLGGEEHALSLLHTPTIEEVNTRIKNVLVIHQLPQAPPPAQKAPSGDIPNLEIRITLADTPISRTLILPSNLPLPQVHLAIQTAFGWFNYHLHQFEKTGNIYTLDSDFPEDLDEKDHTLAHLLPRKGSSCTYTYDFGDDWIHTLHVIDSNSPHPPFTCTASTAANPIEDAGGIDGLLHLHDVLSDPTHEEYPAARHWLKQAFNLTPAKFFHQPTPLEITRKLRKLAPKKRK